MDIQGSQVIGLKVITLDTGKEIEDVNDLLYSAKDQLVYGLLVKNKGLFSEALIIPLEDVQSIGEDAVIVQSETMMKKASELPASANSLATSNQYLTQTKVITEDGDELGQVSDIFFDLESGHVSEFEVSQGALKNIQSGKKRVRVEDIVTVGKDATIVKAFIEAALESQEGGVTGAMKQASSNVGRQVSKTADEAKNTFEAVKTHPKTQEVKSKMQMGYEQVKDKAQSVMNDPELKRSFSNVKNKAQELGNEMKTNAKEAVEKTKAAASSAGQKITSSFPSEDNTTTIKHEVQHEETVIKPVTDKK